MKIVLATLDAIAADVIATGATFDPVGCFIGVGTALTDLGVNTTLADITMPTGGLAVRQEITTWSGPFTMQDGTIYYEAPRMIFHSTSGDPGVTIVCFYIATLITGGALIAYATISPPAILDLDTDAWTLVFRLTIGTNAVGSAEIQANG